MENFNINMLIVSMIFRIAECCGKDWNHQAWKLEPNLRGTNTCMYQECTYVQVHVHKYMVDLWNITCFTPFTIIIDHHTTDLLLRVTHVYQMKTCIGICVCVCTCPVAGDGTSRIPQKRRINRSTMGQKKKTVTAQRVETPQRPFIFVYNKWYIHNRSLLRYWTVFFFDEENFDSSLDRTKVWFEEKNWGAFLIPCRGSRHGVRERKQTNI